MPDDLDDFFAELDAVAARPPAPLPTQLHPRGVADPISIGLPGSEKSQLGDTQPGLRDVSDVSGIPDVEESQAGVFSGSSLDDFFGDAPVGTAAVADTLSSFFGSDICAAENAMGGKSASATLATETAGTAGAAGATRSTGLASAATSLAADSAEANTLGDTAPVMRHTLLCNLSLCPRSSVHGGRFGSGEAVLGPGSWCKVVLRLNEPRQTVELQSWQLPSLAGGGANASGSFAGAVTESVVLSFWKGRAPAELEFTLWLTSHDADNSIHPDDDGSTVVWHRAGTHILKLEVLPLFASTAVPLDDLSHVLRATASVSVRPTDCDILPDPLTKHSRRDEWGFSVELCDPAPTPTAMQTESESVGRDHRRSMQWQRALRRAIQAEKSGADGTQQREYRKELRRICCAGVPSPHRGHAWYVLSGARDKALASTNVGQTAAGSRSTGKVSLSEYSEYQAKLAEAREEIAWYANGGAARLRAKSRATVHGGARLCGMAGGPVGTYTAALIRQNNATNEPGASAQSSINDFGMQLQPSNSGEVGVEVSSVAPGSPAEYAGEMLTRTDIHTQLFVLAGHVCKTEN